MVITFLKSKGKKWQWISSLLMFAVLIIFSVIVDAEDYVYDNHFYWTYGDAVVADRFNFLLFPETFRGYLLPVIVSVFKVPAAALGHEFMAWRLFSALIVTLFFCWILPALFSVKIDSFIRCIRILLLTVVLLYFWGDFLQYPMSDFAACVFMAAGAMILKKILKERFRRAPLLILGVIAGWLLYAAYNTRVANLYGILLLLLIFILASLKQWKKWAAVLVMCFFGALLCAYPQMMINHQYVGSYSPKVYSEQYHGYDYGMDLQAASVYEGMALPRLEAYLGPEDEFPPGAVRYDDPVGLEILSREGLLGNFKMSDVAKLIAKHPMDMAGLYTRHLISGMTLTSGELYIKDMYTDRGFRVALTIILWLISGISIIMVIRKKKRPVSDLLFLATLSIPSFLQILGMVEVRYFLMVYLLAYFGVFVAMDYRWLYRTIKGKLIPVVIVSVTVFLLWTAAFGTILGNERDYTLLIHNQKPIGQMEKME